MPKSPIRRKTVYTPQPNKSAADLPSPRWLAPTMIGFFLFGLLWVVIYYITRGEWPISALNNYSYNGRNLTVNEARPKTAGGGGGYGAGGGGDRRRSEPRW